MAGWWWYLRQCHHSNVDFEVSACFWMCLWFHDKILNILARSVHWKLSRLMMKSRYLRQTSISSPSLFSLDQGNFETDPIRFWNCFKKILKLTTMIWPKQQNYALPFSVIFDENIMYHSAVTPLLKCKGLFTFQVERGPERIDLSWIQPLWV